MLDNPLLREPLKLEHGKPRLLGHWGTTLGLNFIYVHLNRLIKLNDLNVITADLFTKHELAQYGVGLTLRTGTSFSNAIRFRSCMPCEYILVILRSVSRIAGQAFQHFIESVCGRKEHFPQASPLPLENKAGTGDQREFP